MSNADFEFRCYGMPKSAIDKEVARWRTSPLSIMKGDPRGLAFSMLSDTQELIELDCKEEARKKLNVVKYILSEHCKADPTQD